MEDAKSHFDWVLRTAETQREELARKIAEFQRELRELDSTIVGLWRLSGQSPPLQAGRSIQRTLPDSQRFASVSVRWGILLLLYEAEEPMSAPDIAAALQAGGIRSNAKDFNNNVSSVLSTMKGERSEVDVADGKWQITETGRSATEYIKATKLKKLYPRKSAAGVPTPAAPQPKGGEAL